MRKLFKYRPPFLREDLGDSSYGVEPRAGFLLGLVCFSCPLLHKNLLTSLWHSQEIVLTNRLCVFCVQVGRKSCEQWSQAFKKDCRKQSFHSLSGVRTLLSVNGIDISSTSVMDTGNCDCFSVFLLTLSSVFKLLLSFKIF